MADRGTTVSPLAGWLMIVGGAALAMVTFLTWFEIAGTEFSAWEGLRRTDVVIFGAGVLVAACGAWLLFGDVGPEGPAVAAIGAGVAAIAALVVVVRMVSPPDDGDLRIGIFLGLVAALGAMVGGLIALASASPAARSPADR